MSGLNNTWPRDDVNWLKAHVAHPSVKRNREFQLQKLSRHLSVALNVSVSARLNMNGLELFSKMTFL